MKLKCTLAASAIVMLIFVGIAVAAPPAPVPQNLGKDDTLIGNLTTTQCRECHGGQPVPILNEYPAQEIHHFMVGAKTTSLGCPDCHPNEIQPDGTKAQYVDDNCLNCHNGTAWYKNPGKVNLVTLRGAPGKPHHNTSKNSSSNLAIPAKNMAADRNCRGCHGDGWVDNYNDGHEVKNLRPQLVSVFADFKVIDSGGVKWGGCGACHDEGTVGSVDVKNNHDTHHGETTSMLGRQCNYCHVSSGARAEPVPDYSPDPSANYLRIWLNATGNPYYTYYTTFGWDGTQRHMETSNWSMLVAGDNINGTGCLKCHSYRDLHSIEGPSPEGDGDYNIANAIPGYGHVGNDSDCDGCHAGWAPSAVSPVSGPLAVGLGAVTPGSIVAGADTVVTLAGSNLDQSAYTTSVLLDGQSIAFTPVSDSEITATIPGTTSTGVHTVIVQLSGVDGTTTSAPALILVDAPVTIASAQLDAGTLVITGTGFGTESMQQVTIEKAGVQLVSDGISAWSDTSITATSAAAAVGDTVIVTTPYGAASAVISGPPAVLTTITLEPASATVKIGNTRVFTATALDQNGNPMQNVEISFTNSVTRVGTVSPASAVTGTDGTATTTFTAKSKGTTTVTAASGAISDNSAVTVSNK